MEETGKNEAGIWIDSPLLRHWKDFLPWQGETFFEVHNPATGVLLARLPQLGASEAARAVHSAAKAFAKAQGRGEEPALRVKWLEEISALLLEEREALATIITQEQGKPLPEARAEVDYARGFFTYYAGNGERLLASRKVERQGELQWEVHPRPAGVVTLITPWNFPLAMLAKKLSAALLAGCAVVIKPSELTPLTSLALFSLLQRVSEGALYDPATVGDTEAAHRINLVFGDAAAIGKVFCKSDAVRLISFTGSTAVGRLLSEQAAPGLKRLALELGGNAPFIVFEDADLEIAADALISNKFRCAGQTCVCTNRVYVARAVEKEFIALLLERIRRLKVGDGMAEGSDFGPLINRAGYEKVERHVADAVAKGASCILGGGIEPPPGEAQESGFFYPATVLTGVTPEMLVSQEETFGPVISVAAFDSEEAAITEANNTPYGLAAYFFTRDPARIGRCTRQLRFGHVGVNTAAGPAPEAPFGGMKESGYGREGAEEGVLEYCELQTTVRR